LLENEVCTSNQEDKAYVAYTTSQESAYDRYANPDLATSLVSRTAMDVDTRLNVGGGTTFANLAGYLLQPLSAINSLTTMLMGQSYAAATTNCNANSTDFGNVQFGWSQNEENLINSTTNNYSYMPLENQLVLDNNPGKEMQIAQKYAICFGYKFNAGGDGSLDPSDTNGDLVLDSAPGGTASLGTLLADGDIVRDSNGNVINGGGLCDPANLSYESPDTLAADDDSSSPESNDLIFRWRLAMQNDTTIAINHNLQTTTAD